jgi:putative hydrolase of HD superfamily
MGLLLLADRLDALKSVPRTGWLDRGVDTGTVESVADHSIAVALLAWASALQRSAEGVPLDPPRVLLLALVHDLAEADVGDLPPYDPAAIPPAEDDEARRAFLERRHVRNAVRTAQKRVAEDAAMRALLEALPSPVDESLADLWNELQAGTSLEARFVKQVDRLETFLQSLAYQRGNTDLPVESFRQEALETIDDPLLASIRDAALARQARDEPHGTPVQDH